MNAQRDVDQRARIVAAQLRNTTILDNNVRNVNDASFTVLGDDINGLNNLSPGSNKLTFETKYGVSRYGTDVSTRIL